MAERAVAPIQICPLCKGTGWEVDQKENVCSLCEGRNWIVLDTCGGCGRPAFDQLTKVVPYCGRDECLALLTKDVRKTGKVVEFSPFGIMARGGYTPRGNNGYTPPPGSSETPTQQFVREAMARDWRDDHTDRWDT